MGNVGGRPSSVWGYGGMWVGEPKFQGGQPPPPPASLSNGLVWIWFLPHACMLHHNTGCTLIGFSVRGFFGRLIHDLHLFGVGTGAGGFAHL